MARTVGLVLVGVLCAACAAGSLQVTDLPTQTTPATKQPTRTTVPTPPSSSPTVPSTVGPTAPVTSPTNSSPGQTDAWVWELAPRATDHPGTIVGPSDEGPGDGEFGGVFGYDDEGGEPTPGEGDHPLDPCTLVDGVEWPPSMGGTGTLTPLEGGAACGLIGDGDEMRVALAVFPIIGERRWSDGLDLAAADPVEFGEQAWWLAGWPIGQSSTLIVMLVSQELVIEVSARTAGAGEAMQDTALYYAREAALRLP